MGDAAVLESESHFMGRHGRCVCVGGEGVWGEDGDEAWLVSVGPRTAAISDT